MSLQSLITCLLIVAAPETEAMYGIKSAGVLYLSYLAWTIWRDKGEAVTLLVFAVYGVIAGRLQALIVARTSIVRTLNKVFAVSFVAVGSRLAMEK